jgi:tungstate transport system substrate-binding protein
MNSRWRFAARALLLGFCIALPMTSAWAAKSVPTVRVAVVGGLQLCGVWPELARRAEAATGLRIETVAAAPKEGVVPSFASGEAELLLIHGSDETYELQAQGLAAPLRAWARNEHVILGPASDPARVGTARDGVDAIRRIAKADFPLIGYRDPGSFATMHHLWRAAGLRPGPRHQLFDDGEPPRQVILAAARQNAYVLVGHIPVAFGRMPTGDYRVLLAGDPAMRRVYVVVEPGPHHPANAGQRARAHRLATFLLSPRGQASLAAANTTIATPERPGPWVMQGLRTRTS